MEDKTDPSNAPQNPSQKGNVKFSIKKILLFVFLGLLIGIAIAAAIYFLLVKKNDQSGSDTTSNDQTNDEVNENPVEAINPSTLEFDSFVDENKQFSFEYPSTAIRTNVSDLNKQISEESKEKFNTNILFLGVLKESDYVVQITASSYTFKPKVSLSDILDDLVKFSTDQGVTPTITEKSISESDIKYEASYIIEDAPYKAIERILVAPVENDVRRGYSISILVSEEIYEKYKNVAQYITESAILGDLTEKSDSDLMANSELVKNIYLGKYPKGSEGSTDAEGVTQTSVFNKEEDQICLVTDLTASASNFSIEIFDNATDTLVTSSYNTMLEKGLSSGCNEINFGPGDFMLKVSRNEEVIKEIEFEVE